MVFSNIREDRAVLKTPEVITGNHLVWPEGVDLLRRLYNIDGLVPAHDRDYDPVREAVDSFGAR